MQADDNAPPNKHIRRGGIRMMKLRAMLEWTQFTKNYEVVGGDKTTTMNSTQGNAMCIRTSVSDPVNVPNPWRDVLSLGAGFVLLGLIGCSSEHALQLDASQPVYFGNAPQAVLPLDSAHVRIVKHVLVATSHLLEKEKVVQGSWTSFTKEASEGVVGDVAAQVGDALGSDLDRFIGNGEIRTRIEAYIPFDTMLTDILGSIFFTQSTAQGTGEASSETIEVSGILYKIRRSDR